MMESSDWFFNQIKMKTLEVVDCDVDPLGLELLE